MCEFGGNYWCGGVRERRTRCHLLSHNVPVSCVKLHAFTLESNCGRCRAKKEYEVNSVVFYADKVILRNI